MTTSKGTAFSLREMLGAGLLAALTAVLGYVRIPLPFSPVPITGQTFGVMLAGSLLGARGGFWAMVLYLLLGAVGVPVFAGGSAGIGVLAGPSGGYLLSFPLAAYTIGKLACPAEGNNGLLRLGIANLIGGIVVIYTLGVLQLNYVTGMGLGPALLNGALPFIPGDLFKVAVAAMVTNRVWVAFPVMRAHVEREGNQASSP